MTSRPPRLFEALLSFCLPPGRIREGVLGDQAELHHRRVRTDGLPRARWAYAAAAVALSFRYLLPRLRGIRISTQGQPMDSFFQDLRIGIRALFKQPGSTGLSIVAFALGIGLCATMVTTSGFTQIGDIETALASTSYSEYRIGDHDSAPTHVSDPWGGMAFEIEEATAGGGIAGAVSLYHQRHHNRAA